MAVEDVQAAALAGMARIGNPRVPMGDAPYNVKAGAAYVPSKNTTLRKKGGAEAADPTPPTAIRGRTAYPLPAGDGDRNGAKFRIQAKFPPSTLPEAGQTLANGRIVKSAINRSLPAFSNEQSLDY